MSEKTVFLDEKHNVVSKDKAKWNVIHKYDDEGELIDEVWVDLKKEE